MAFDGILIFHLIKELDILKTGRISKVSQLSATDFLFLIRANQKNNSLFLSIHPEYGHLCLTTKEYENDKSSTLFLTILKKYVEGGIIKEITQYQTDRIITISLTKSNEIGDKMDIEIHLELTGKHANIIICQNNIVINAYKTISPFDNNERTIIPSSPYSFPKSNKLNPFTDDKCHEHFETIHCAKDLANIYQGVSLLLANYAYHNCDFFYKTINSFSPCIIKGEKKSFFYYTDLLYLEGERIFFKSINEVIDNFYYDKSRMEQIKAKSHNIKKNIEKKINKQENKLEKLREEMTIARNNDLDRLFGELIFANINKMEPHLKEIVVMNYYNNVEQVIPLNPLLSPKQNALHYYSQYQKKKNALVMLPVQIEKTLDEINYLKLLEEQVDLASINDIIDISNELNEKKEKKRKKPLFLRFIANNYEIIIGKNNLQNTLLLKELALPNDLWFHVQNSPSSHVFLRGEVNEESLRLASNLCAYYSKYRFSSSVAVDYTLVKYLKRIPGKKGCFVNYTNQKTIYIDPDIQTIEKLKLILK